MYKSSSFNGHSEMLGVGDSAPDFSLESHRGGVIQLSELRGRNVVLFFYPKDGSPGCTKENCLLRDLNTEFEKLDAVVLGISRDGVEEHRKFSEKHGLNHHLLSDRDGSVSKKYDALGLLGVVKRVTYVLDREHRVRGVIRSWQPSKHVSGALEILRRLSAAEAI
jgi:peroxiredoxin Q/BCP